MRTKGFVFTFCTLLFALSYAAQAQQPKKVYRVGFLAPGASLNDSPSNEAFRQVTMQSTLRRTISSANAGNCSESPFAKRHSMTMFCPSTYPSARRPWGITAIHAAKQATSAIPIVMNVNDDPVQMGLIASLSRPGGNITGSTAIGAELAGKRLELLKAALPKVHRVGHLWGSSTGAAHLREIEAPARALRVQLQSLGAKGPGELEHTFRTAGKETDALIVVAAGWINSHRARILDLAVKGRLPVMYTQTQFVLEGGLMGYAADNLEQHRRAAVYVDRILKGAKPADLPVEQPTTFELMINLKAAKQIGVTISPNVLARADKVIR